MAKIIKTRCVLYLTPDKQERFKLACAVARKSMSEVFDEMVDQFIAPKPRRKRT